MSVYNEISDKDLLHERLQDFVKILTFLETTSVLNLFGGKVNEYVYSKKNFLDFHKKTSDERAKLVGNVYKNIALYNQTGMNRDIIRRIFGSKPNTNEHFSTKDYLPLIEKYSDRKHGTYIVKAKRHSFTKHYSIGYAELKKIFDDKELLKRVLDAESDYYSKRQKKLIFKILEDNKTETLVKSVVGKINAAEELIFNEIGEIMTKAEKEQYQKEYE